MGMSCASVEMIIQEHLYRPIQGKVLLIGRQNTDITPQAMINLLALYDLKPRISLVLETPGSLEHKTLTLSDDTARIADVSVFHSLADCEVMALDISDYEGAEIIHDLNLPLPEKYKNQFDFIFDGSSMDNIFNGPQALISLSELLRPGGRLLLYNAANSSPTAYLQYSPDWVFDFFAVNGYADCKVYIHEFPWDFEQVVPASIPPGGFPPQTGCFWHFDPLVVYSGQFGFQNSEIKDGGQRFYHAIAEKADNSTSNIAPVQMHYRGSNRAVYVEAARRFRESSRPIVYPRTGERFNVPSISAWEVVYPLTRWSRRSYSEQIPSPHRNEAPAIEALEGAELTAERLLIQRDRAIAQRDEALRRARQFEQEKNDRVKERDRYLTERDQARQTLIKRILRKAKTIATRRRSTAINKS